ncbi:MAG: hypothetical protein ACRD98_06350 [Nitrososphaera sp.]
MSLSYTVKLAEASGTVLSIGPVVATALAAFLVFLLEHFGNRQHTLHSSAFVLIMSEEKYCTILNSVPK